MQESQIILYTTPKGDIKVEIRFEDEIFWGGTLRCGRKNGK